jgi:arylsulfatase A-like enzyme
MKPLRFLATLAVALLAWANTQAADSTKPNVIFILADDAGLGDFGPYGAKEVLTPNLDRFAAEGMKFTRAYSGSAVCAPTRCVLMTGLHTGHCLRRANQSKHGLLALAEGQMTVARLLKQSGYATGGFGKWGLGNPGTTGVPEKQGFDTWYGYYDQVHAHDYYTDHLIRNSAKAAIPENADGAKKVYTHHLIANETLKFIETNKDRPFFVYAAWTPPHGDYVVPSDSPYGSKPWSQKIKNYAAMVSLVDSDVGRILQKLKELKLEENTLVIFSSDNGANPDFAKELGSTAGLRGYKRLLYDGGCRTPFLARWPGKIKAGSTSDLLTSHVDFLATAAELAGAATPKGLDSISILPTLLGRAQTVKHEHLYFEIYEGPVSFQQAVRLGDWKGWRDGTKRPLELYDLKADPAEKSNLAAQHPDIVKKIEAIITAEHRPSPDYDAPEQPVAKGGKKKGKAKADDQ